MYFATWQSLTIHCPMLFTIISIKTANPTTALASIHTSWSTTEVSLLNDCNVANASDEVSAVVVDFGSHTTRAGYAGEDGPRIVTPSFYGYTDEASGSGENDAHTDGDDPMDGEKKGKRKYYFGEDGVGVWRPGMEVGNFMVDGVGELR